MYTNGQLSHADGVFAPFNSSGEADTSLDRAISQMHYTASLVTSC